MKFYYASAIEDSRRARKALLAGPYLTHAEALQVVDRVRRRAEDIDPRAAFWYFGTAGSDEQFATRFGPLTP